MHNTAMDTMDTDYEVVKSRQDKTDRKDLD